VTPTSDRSGRDQYGPDVLANDPHRRSRPTVRSMPAERDLVVEHLDSGWCGAVVRSEKSGVVLEDRHGRRRLFAWEVAAFAVDGRPVTLERPVPSAPAVPTRSRSGSRLATDAVTRVAQQSRIYVEGVHDAEIVEHVWGHDLRVEGVVVEPLHGIDDLPAVVADFGPSSQRRLGILVDHLVAGSKEQRVVSLVRSPHVLVTGHPYVDVWEAVRPASVGIDAWPQVPRGTQWKAGVCRALGVPDEREMWRRIRRSVHSYADLEVPMLRAVEELIDFVTTPTRSGLG